MRQMDPAGNREKRKQAKRKQAKRKQEMRNQKIRNQKKERSGNASSMKYAVCINEEVKISCPLIGREAELERTMQVLCRHQKNNPLHIGEPGVGKTAITYGLAARINEGRVPEKLKNARISPGIDLGSMVAGTRFPGRL